MYRSCLSVCHIRAPGRRARPTITPLLLLVSITHTTHAIMLAGPFFLQTFTGRNSISSQSSCLPDESTRVFNMIQSVRNHITFNNIIAFYLNTLPNVLDFSFVPLGLDSTAQFNTCMTISRHLNVAKFHSIPHSCV